MMRQAPWGRRGQRLRCAAQPPASRTGCTQSGGSHAASFSSPRRSEYYPTQEAYLYAIADAMREAYQRIVEAGFLLQIDDPRLVSYYGANPGLGLAQCLEWAELRVEVLNDALRDIPPEKVRYHTCYGINIGPRVQEVSFQDVVHLLLKINAGAYSLKRSIRVTSTSGISGNRSSCRRAKC